MAVKGCGGFGTPTVLVLLRSKEQINKIINYLMNDGEAETNITANSYNLHFIIRNTFYLSSYIG